MKKFLNIHVILLILCTSSCTKKDLPPTSSPQSTGGKITPKGLPVGAAFAKTIGIAGGLLQTEDSSISVVIPAGAVTTNTVLSIQPIVNNAPNGTGNAYRLMPEGIQFNIPVKISLRYSEESIEGSSPELLWIAWQSANGIWNAKARSSLNTNPRSLTIESDHFGDWAIFQRLRLRTQGNVLPAGQTTALWVEGANLYGSFDNAEMEVGVAGNVEKIGNWRLSGEGKLVSASSAAAYTAPSAIPASNPVFVSVDVTDILNNEGANGKMILISRLYIADNYFFADFDGHRYLFTDVNASSVADLVLISGNLGTKANILLTVNLSGQGTHPFDVKPLIPTQILAGFNGNGYLSYYESCSLHKTVPTGGSITISKFGEVGTYIDGSFKGAVAAGNRSCDPTLSAIVGRFHVKRNP